MSRERKFLEKIRTRFKDDRTPDSYFNENTSGSRFSARNDRSVRVCEPQKASEGELGQIGKSGAFEFRRSAAAKEQSRQTASGRKKEKVRPTR